MKLTKAELEKIIKEELGRFTEEDAPAEEEEEIPQDKLIAELGGLLDKLNTRFKMIKGEAFPALMKNIVSRMLQGGPNNGRVKVNDARLLFKDLYNTIGKE